MRIFHGPDHTSSRKSIFEEKESYFFINILNEDAARPAGLKQGYQL